MFQNTDFISTFFRCRQCYTKMPCPFIARMGGNFLNKYGSLVKLYAEHCPAIGSGSPSFRGVSTNITNLGATMSTPKPVKDCPYLNEDNVYDYEGFFEDQILKKKMDHTYRVFKKVNRNAQNFPAAHEYTWGEKEINVWCSNDYLGMSAHPKVTTAVR